MDRAKEYIIGSLEQHLFFARIMKEHAFFLKVGFLPPNASFAKESEQLMRKFEELLARAIALSDHRLRRCFLDSCEIFTEFTDCAETQTQTLTGTAINCGLTARAKRLNCFDCDADLHITQPLLHQIRRLNQDGLQLVECLIVFKERLLCSLGSCSIFTVNYPLLIEHILREARLYRAHLLRLEGMSNRGSREICDSELFWNRIMMEHALFIRGLLDPSEETLIHSADSFASDYKRLLERSAAANDKVMRRGGTLALTQKFRDFKQAGVSGIEECKIRSIILPLLADHVLREANHYIRLLEE